MFFVTPTDRSALVVSWRPPTDLFGSSHRAACIIQLYRKSTTTSHTHTQTLNPPPTFFSFLLLLNLISFDYIRLPHRTPPSATLRCATTWLKSGGGWRRRHLSLVVMMMMTFFLFLFSFHSVRFGRCLLLSFNLLTFSLFFLLFCWHCTEKEERELFVCLFCGGFLFQSRLGKIPKDNRTTGQRSVSVRMEDDDGLTQLKKQWRNSWCSKRINVCTGGGVASTESTPHRISQSLFSPRRPQDS